MMAVFKTDVLLSLALLLSSAEATNFSDPIICYVLDAVLLMYCIIFTALYFKLKFEKTKGFDVGPDKSTGVAQAAEEEGAYQALSQPSNDDYQEIQRRDRAQAAEEEGLSQPRKKKSKSKQPKSKRNAAESIEMKPAPPLPTRK